MTWNLLKVVRVKNQLKNQLESKLTLPETNTHQNERLVSQSSSFRCKLLVSGSAKLTTLHHLKEIKPRSVKHKKYGAPRLTHFSCGLLSCRAKGQKIFIPGGMSSQVDVNFREYEFCKLYEFDIHIISIYISDFYPSKLGIFVGCFDSEDCPNQSSSIGFRDCG